MVISLGEARAAGLTRQQLRGKQWTRVGYGLYAPSGEPADRVTLLAAIARALPDEAAFSGRTAAWLLGLDVDPSAPIDVTIPPHCGVSRAAGVCVRRARLCGSDVVLTYGLRVTSIGRTLCDLAWRLPLTEAVVVADMALHAHKLRGPELADWIAANRGTKGIARLQAVADLADGRAESAMESRLRLLLMDAGLPRPESQVAIFDPDGHFVARVDLYFRNARLAVEYDGATHRDSLLADNRRQNELLGVGVALLRYCADDVYNRKHTIAGQVRDRFASAGIRLDFGKQRQPKPGGSQELSRV